MTKTLYNFARQVTIVNDGVHNLASCASSRVICSANWRERMYAPSTSFQALRRGRGGPICCLLSTPKKVKKNANPTGVSCVTNTNHQNDGKRAKRKEIQHEVSHCAAHRAHAHTHGTFIGERFAEADVLSQCLERRLGLD